MSQISNLLFEKPILAEKKTVHINRAFLRQFYAYLPSFIQTNVLSKVIRIQIGIEIIVFNARNQNTTMNVSRYAMIPHVKIQIEKLPNFPKAHLQRLFHRNIELVDRKRLLDYDLLEGSRVFVSKQIPPIKLSIKPFGIAAMDKQTKQLIKPIYSGIIAGHAPELAMEGTGGAYFLKDGRNNPIAVFKPHDEEPFAPNNPRVYQGNLGSPGFKPGLTSGSGARRERVAYLLDHDSFSSVPFTTMVEFQNFIFSSKQTPAQIFRKSRFKHKIGSLQHFVKYESKAGDYGESLFSVEQVHKIAILDIRILNLDRNDGNILLRFDDDRKNITLIPIDHGYSLPSTLEVRFYDWVWYSWPQINQPLSAKSKDFIAKINIDEDAEILRQNDINEESIAIFKYVNLFLKKAISIGLSLGDISRMILRSKGSNISEFESIISTATVLTLIRLNNGDSLPRTTSEVNLESFMPSQNSPPCSCVCRHLLHNYPCKEECADIEIPPHFGENRVHCKFKEMLQNYAYSHNINKLIDFSLQYKILQKQKSK